MTKKKHLEVYSDELVRSSNNYHQLHVAIAFLIEVFTDAENDMNTALEELSKTAGHKREPYKVVSDELCSGQLIPDSILRFSSAATGEMPPLNA